MGPDDFRRKMSDRFATFDQDRDGLVSARDFASMAQAILAHYGLSARSPKGQRLLDGANRFFVGLAETAGTDGSGQLNESQFVEAAFNRLRNNPAGFTSIGQVWVEAAVSVADTDDDGIIDTNDWRHMKALMGANPVGIDEEIRLLDRDKSGSIDVKEILVGARTFYITDVYGGEFGALGKDAESVI